MVDEVDDEVGGEELEVGLTVVEELWEADVEPPCGGGEVPPVLVPGGLAPPEEGSTPLPVEDGPPPGISIFVPLVCICVGGQILPTIPGVVDYYQKK